MNKQFANRKSVLFIVVAISLLYGVQTSFAQGEAPTVTETDTPSSLRVSFGTTLYPYDENAYQFQLRREVPQGDWITDCVDISHRGRVINVQIYTHFRSLEPGVTYEARYRDTNLAECHDTRVTDPPSPRPWSRLGEGTTLTENLPVAVFIDATLAFVVRETLGLDVGNGVDIHNIPIADLSKLRSLSARGSMLETRGMPEITDLSGLEHATQLMTLDLGYNRIRDVTPLAQMESLATLELDHNRIRDISPLATLTGLSTLSLYDNQIRDVSSLAQLSDALENLDLRDNRIQDVTPLASFTYLERLRLRGNPIADTSPLAALIDGIPDLRVDIRIVK